MAPLGELLAHSRIAEKAFRTELAAAFDLWRAAANISFSEAGDGEAADIVIGAQGVPQDRAFAQVFYDEAAAGRDKPITRSLICLNPRMPWKIGFDGDLKVYDLRYTLAHEIGHAIGLDHSQAGQLMWFRYDERFREPQPGDTRGAVALYGTRGGTATRASAER